MPENAKVKEVRRHYNEVKKLRNQVGKKALGKPRTSAVHKDYETLNREYKKVGQQLGKLTKKKPRRS